MSEITVTPASRREVWLTIALAVARDGLPEPESLQLMAGLRGVDLTLDTLGEAWAWAAYTRATPERPEPILSHDGMRHIHVWFLPGHESPFPGWSVRLHVSVAAEEGPAASPLAAEVAAAILLPDREPAGTAA